MKKITIGDLEKDLVVPNLELWAKFSRFFEKKIFDRKGEIR